MKPTEIEQLAISKANQLRFINGTHRTGFINGYQQGYGEAISQMQPEWVAIKSKSDLPKEPCEMWVFDQPSQMVVHGNFRASKEDYNYWLANASHYMIITKPQKPQPPKERTK